MTILFPSPVFGPVRSRRLGISLGINLMPPDGKRCTFDCVYCECGFNATHRPTAPRPTRSQVAEVLEAQLEKMAAQGELPDVLTFAGNGEPTAHPDFPAIIDDTIALRNRYCPAAKVAVLSNATLCHRPDVRAALLKVDDNIQKLDTVSPDYIRAIDRPTGRYDVGRVVEALTAFGGHVIVQTMFMAGTTQSGFNADNTGADYVRPWLEALRTIRPAKVMIYTIDRDTPDPGLRKATPATLDAIADEVRAAGMEVSVSY
ncbi:MAG: radical SAM protein [Bacteroidaceae bacterium]|nr:radical SAM protein [Bacteroidaceae bacterium]